MVVRRGRARKFWVVWHKGEPAPRFPRVEQLVVLVWCFFRGHDWSTWQTDDYDGPMDGEMPLLSRPARPDEEFAYRACMRRCGTTEDRRPDPPVKVKLWSFLS